MRSFQTLISLFLFAGVVLAAPAQTPGGIGGQPGKQGQSKIGTGSESQNHAQARGDGPFTIHVGDMLGPPGHRLSGAVDPGLTDVAADIYRPYTVTGALTRTDVHMWEDSRDLAASAMLKNAHGNGFQLMMTFVGTRLDNTTAPDSGSPDAWEYAPARPQEWADDLVNLLVEIRDSCGGDMPDYIKVWNEPDQTATYLGTRAEFVDLFGVALRTLEQALAPGGALAGAVTKIGGPGMGDWDSDMEGEGPVLYELLEEAADPVTGFRLDYLCWHEYFSQKPASSLRFYQPIQKLQDYATYLGVWPMELVVDEWNVFPSVINNPQAVYLDCNRAAADAIIFLAGAAKTNPDAVAFFQLEDVDPTTMVDDLGGAGNGLLSRRGVRKPAFRVLELLRPMLDQERVRVEFPENEWAAGVLATRSGNRVRVMVANDPVRGTWVWAEGARERGGLPGIWGDIYYNTLECSHGGPITLTNLLSCNPGLSVEEAQAILELIPIAEQAEDLERAPRMLQIQLEGVNFSSVQLQYPAYRFTDVVNNPALYQEELQPLLNMVEVDARQAAYDAAYVYLAAHGETHLVAFNPNLVAANTIGLITMMHITDPDNAAEAFPIYEHTLEDQRLAQETLLNSQPATVLYEDTPADAGISYDPATGVITVNLPAPDPSLPVDYSAGMSVVFDFAF